MLPSRLSSWDLTMNEEKTEELTIKRNGEETWKKFKLLGTLLDTEEDVKKSTCTQCCELSERDFLQRRKH